MRISPYLERGAGGWCGEVKAKREGWEERAWGLLAEQQADRRLPMDEWVKKRLRWEDWRTLGPEAARFAAPEPWSAFGRNRDALF